jgi:hypothetical protein
MSHGKLTGSLRQRMAQAIAIAGGAGNLACALGYPAKHLEAISRGQHAAPDSIRRFLARSWLAMRTSRAVKRHVVFDWTNDCWTEAQVRTGETRWWKFVPRLAKGHSGLYLPGYGTAGVSYRLHLHGWHITNPERTAHNGVRLWFPWVHSP